MYINVSDVSAPGQEGNSPHSMNQVSFCKGPRLLSLLHINYFVLHVS